MKGKAALTWMLGAMMLLISGCGHGRKESAFEALATRKQIEGLTREQFAGKQLYDHYCAVCHAKTGTGDGFNAFNLKDSFGVMPTNLTEPGARLSLDQLKQIISQGGASAGKSKYMPRWDGVFDEPRIHVIARYVQSFQQPKTATPAASK
jgi:mono/diheme cytochrome c family protein